MPVIWLNGFAELYPDLCLLVARFGQEPGADSRTVKQIDGFVRTLADSRKRLAELHPILLATYRKAEENRDNKEQPVGTTRA